jgi:MFS family permease
MMPEAHDPYGALRHRDYRRFLGGGVLFNLGMEMQAVAVGWELYLLTDSAAALGFVGLAQFLPVLLLALPAGQAADRYNRKKLLMSAQSLGVLTSMGLAALSYWQGPVPLIYLCLVIVGVVRAFNVPTRWALLPQVVPPEALPNAVTWNSSGWQIANVAGPALGGLVLATTLPAAAYLVTAMCGLCCVALISTIRPRAVARTVEPRSLETLLAGIRFVRQSRPILATITLDLFAVLLGGATALLPIFAKDILHAGPWEFGVLRAAPSVGAFMMALVLAHHPPLRHAGKTLLAAVAGFGLATVVFGVSPNLSLSCAMLLVTGAFDNVSVVVRGTLVQTLTPEAMRGRVAAVNYIFVSSSNELGAFESGVTAEFFGPVASVVMGGVGTVLVVLSVMALWPEIIRLSLERPVTKQEPDPTDETVAPPA